MLTKTGVGMREMLYQVGGVEIPHFVLLSLDCSSLKEVVDTLSYLDFSCDASITVIAKLPSHGQQRHAHLLPLLTRKNYDPNLAYSLLSLQNR